jgi:hypothetical protein
MNYANEFIIYYLGHLVSRLESESATQKQLKETAIADMQKLMTLVQRTTVSTVLFSEVIF